MPYKKIFLTYSIKVYNISNISLVKLKKAAAGEIVAAGDTGSTGESMDSTGWVVSSAGVWVKKTVVLEMGLHSAGGSSGLSVCPQKSLVDGAEKLP